MVSVSMGTVLTKNRGQKEVLSNQFRYGGVDLSVPFYTSYSWLLDFPIEYKANPIPMAIQ